MYRLGWSTNFTKFFVKMISRKKNYTHWTDKALFFMKIPTVRCWCSESFSISMSFNKLDRKLTMVFSLVVSAALLLFPAAFSNNVSRCFSFIFIFEFAANFWCFKWLFKRLDTLLMKFDLALELVLRFFLLDLVKYPGTIWLKWFKSWWNWGWSGVWSQWFSSSGNCGFIFKICLLWRNFEDTFPCIHIT